MRLSFNFLLKKFYITDFRNFFLPLIRKINKKNQYLKNNKVLFFRIYEEVVLNYQPYN